jgi:hypothetical protein
MRQNLAKLRAPIPPPRSGFVQPQPGADPIQPFRSRRTRAPVAAGSGRSRWPFAMTIIKRRVCSCVACGVLLAAGITAFRPANVAVNGLSSEDITQIRYMVRSEIWRSVATKLSLSGIRHAPREIWHLVSNRITPPEQWQDLSPLPQNTWLIITTQGDLFTLDKRQGHWRIVGRG